MEETDPWEQAAVVAIALVCAITPILIIGWRLRRRWRAASAATGLPLLGKKCIEADTAGGQIEAKEDFRTVYVGPASDLPDQVVTRVLGILDSPPPEAFVASTDGSCIGGPAFTTGEAEFDASVVVGAKDADAGRAYLTPARRRALLRFFAAVPRGALSAGRVGRVRDGRMGAAELTRTLVAVKVALADLQDGQPR